ncbi:hypothetical protein K437DRAFT_38111 [Tilletiaria anomala UBC 951]|uniref:MHYT domain-containing protein n=1 Tax=Tilletiaria anomala (strain ATCC 24038 / CBS 436.72 / UBC 951) TaxID=1037660 RepID=A0A066V6T2_TILAU|nr:uncharacterized protein K437DRAFT_38111 [Tilletiaria anomala UBC 951]KDN37452.1 hypothetical protein K437DRAFT_38111 [Tilletiaria anomala UBC 951]
MSTPSYHTLPRDRRWRIWWPRRRLESMVCDNEHGFQEVKEVGGPVLGLALNLPTTAVGTGPAEPPVDSREPRPTERWAEQVHFNSTNASDAIDHEERPRPSLKRWPYRAKSLWAMLQGPMWNSALRIILVLGMVPIILALMRSGSSSDWQRSNGNFPPGVTASSQGVTSAQRHALVPFVTNPTTAVATAPIGVSLSKTYVPTRIILSLLVSLYGSITTLELLSARVGNTGFWNVVVLLAAGCSFGAGATWLMHFIANNALYLGIPDPLPQDVFPIIFQEAFIFTDDGEQVLGPTGLKIMTHDAAMQLLHMREDVLLPLLYVGPWFIIGLILTASASMLSFALMSINTAHPRWDRFSGMCLKKSDRWSAAADLNLRPGRRATKQDEDPLSSLDPRSELDEIHSPALRERWNGSISTLVPSSRRGRYEEGMIEGNEHDAERQPPSICDTAATMVPSPIVAESENESEGTAVSWTGTEDSSSASSALSQRRRILLLTVSGLLNGAAINGMFYAGQKSFFYLRYNYIAAYVICGILASEITVVAAFILLFEVLKPRLLDNSWARLPLAFVLSGGTCLMHYTASFGTQFYLTTDQLADILLNPGRWRAGMLARGFVSELAAGLSVGLAFILICVGLVAHRSSRKQSQHRKASPLMLAVFLFNKQGNVLVDSHGVVPMVRLNKLDAPLISPTLSPSLPRPAQDACATPSLTARFIIWCQSKKTTMSNQPTPSAQDITSISALQPVFARCVHLTVDWRTQSSLGCTGTKTRSDSLSTARSSKLRPAAPETVDARLINDLNNFLLGGGLSECTWPNDACRIHEGPMEQSGTSQGYKSDVLLRCSRGNRRFEDLFTKAVEELAEKLFCDGSERAELGLLFHSVLDLGRAETDPMKSGHPNRRRRCSGTLGQMMVLTRIVEPTTGLESALQRGFFFADPRPVGRRLADKIGLQPEPAQLLSSISSFALDNGPSKGQIRPGSCYLGILIARSSLRAGLEISVDPIRRHMLPMVELGTLSKADGSESFGAVGTPEQLQTAITSIGSRSLLELLQQSSARTEECSGWAPQLVRGDKQSAQQCDFVQQAQHDIDLTSLMCRTATTWLEATFGPALAAFLVARLVLVPTLEPLLLLKPHSHEQAYLLTFSAVVSPDVNVPRGLTWSSYTLFEIYNSSNLRAMPPQSRRSSRVVPGITDPTTGNRPFSRLSRVSLLTRRSFDLGRHLDAGPPRRKSIATCPAIQVHPPAEESKVGRIVQSRFEDTGDFIFRQSFAFSAPRPSMPEELIAPDCLATASSPHSTQRCAPLPLQQELLPPVVKREPDISWIKTVLRERLGVHGPFSFEDAVARVDWTVI